MLVRRWPRLPLACAVFLSCMATIRKRIIRIWLWPERRERTCVLRACPRASWSTATLITVEAELRGAGERPYPLPRGGATAIAAIGSAHAAVELDAQLSVDGIDAEVVLLATGSGTTQAGLVAGSVAAGSNWRVVGASISRPEHEARAQVRRLADECAALMGTAPTNASHIDVRDARGPGYGIPSDAGDRAARVALREAGLLLDPVFTAKAFALLPALLAEGARRPIVFWHTGGIPVALTHLLGRNSPV